VSRSRTVTEPKRFAATGTALRVRDGRSRAVRVAIALRHDPVLARALERRVALSGRLAGSELAALRRGKSGAAAAAHHERVRHRALDALDPAARVASKSQQRLARLVDSLGGRVAGRDVATGILVATVPPRAIPRIAREPAVESVDLASVKRPLGLETSSAAVGAPAFWSRGFIGGAGPADSSPVDLAIVSDKIDEDHPAFAGIDFQRPSDSSRGTRCGQYGNGCEHGTEVASMAVSRGASGCAVCVPGDASKRGIAAGLDSVIDADVTDASGNDLAWALGIPSDEVEGALDPAEVLSDSHGSVESEDDNANLRGTDRFISAYGAIIAYPAGNEGPARTVNDACIAYDTLCMGGFDTKGTVDSADDVIPDFSSRGPSPGGRKKPDLVAVADSEFANQHWIRDGRLWSGGTGTSLAAPQGAAAAALLAGSGIASPLAQKAILVDSARQGRATPASPMGTQAGWQADWGWGALDLESALRERTHFYTDEVPGGEAHFYRTAIAAQGDRATLVWNRRALGCVQAGCSTTALTLTDLDLEQLDPDTGATLTRSASTIDNVEQVRSPSIGDAIYKVKATSSVDGLPAEPYAIAARRQVTPLAVPRPVATATVGAAAARLGDPVTVVASVENASADLTGEDAAVAIELPPGVELAPGSPAPTRSLGTLAERGAPGATATVAWTVRATGDAVNRIRVTARAGRYGETFASSDDVVFTSDGTPPAPTIATPAGETTDPRLPVAWSATDSGTGVRDFDVEVSTDGGPFAPWLPATTAASATYEGAAGHAYRFRVRARDRLATPSAYLASPEVRVAAATGPGGDPPSPPATGPGGDPPGPPPPPATARTSPDLRVGSVRRRGSRLLVTGTIVPLATARVTVAGALSARGRRTRPRATARPRGGRFQATLPLPRAAAGTITVSYPGDARFAPQAVRRRLR
jgi:hypothetical protein